MTDIQRDTGERAFALLLRLYPRSFRERFGEEMLDFFRLRRLEQNSRGATGARLWAHLVMDVLLSAPVQHARALTRTHAPEREIAWSAPGYPPEMNAMDTLVQDIRYASRALVRHPGFALVAALTLALGIGANTAIFSVVDAVLLRPLPWPDSDRLVTITGARNGQPSGVVYLDFKDWQEQSASFEELAAWRGQSVNLTGVETPERLVGAFVNAAMLRIAGASAVLGRLMTDEESGVETKVPVAIVTEPVWRTRYGSRPDMIGQTMVINGQPFTVIGVLRAGFQSPQFTPHVFLPLGYYPNSGDLTTRGRPGIAAIGKLKRGVTLVQAQKDMDAVAARIAESYPTTNAGTGILMQSLREQIIGPSRLPLTIVLASVGIVLLIACANVANLQLARATSRRRELAVRAALGAGRLRLMRQLLTESLALSLLGGVGGLAIAYAGTRYFATVVPNVLVSYGPIALNGAVMFFAALVTVVTGALFGLVPAWRASRAQGQETMAMRGASSGGVKLRAHQALVVAQISLCVILMVCAGLLSRSLIALAKVEPGFEPGRVLTLQFRVPNTKYDSEARIAEMFSRTLAAVRGVAGVERAALARATPLNGNGELFRYQVDGSGETDPGKLPQAQRNLISDGYFETLKLPRIAGRDFTDQDKLGSAPVAIVNEQVARRIDPAGQAVGRRIRLMDGTEMPAWATIVGVVGNAKHFQVNEQQLDQVYLPTLQRPLIFTEIVVRSTADNPALIGTAVRNAIQRVDPDQPVWGIRPLQVSIDNQLGGRRFQMGLLGGFSVVAVLLALIGVYGVMSYGVASRTQEMGVRMALGAARSQVVGLVLRQGMSAIAIAIVLGLVGASFVTKALRSQLFGVEAVDPLTFAAVPLAIGLVALVACYLPARRASKVDPVVALRSD